MQMGKGNITEIRQHLEGHVGNRVQISANKGRKRIVMQEGVLESTYPCVFMVRVREERGSYEHQVTYMYSDVLTKDVVIEFV